MRCITCGRVLEKVLPLGSLVKGREPKTHLIEEGYDGIQWGDFLDFLRKYDFSKSLSPDPEGKVAFFLCLDHIPRDLKLPSSVRGSLRWVKYMEKEEET